MKVTKKYLKKRSNIKFFYSCQPDLPPTRQADAMKFYKVHICTTDKFDLSNVIFIDCYLNNREYKKNKYQTD